VDKTVPCPDPLNGAAAGRVCTAMQLYRRGTPRGVLLTERHDLGFLKSREAIGGLARSAPVVGHGVTEGDQGTVPILVEITTAYLIPYTYVRHRFPP